MIFQRVSESSKKFVNKAISNYKAFVLFDLILKIKFFLMMGTQRNYMENNLISIPITVSITLNSFSSRNIKFPPRKAFSHFVV